MARRNYGPSLSGDQADGVVRPVRRQYGDGDWKREPANLGEQSRYPAVLGSALLARLSDRALEVGIEYFTTEVLAENRSMLGLLAALGQVESESVGPVVSARVEIAAPPGQAAQDLLDLLTPAARGDIVGIPVALRRFIRVPDGWLTSSCR